jgi:hypothetical protein
MLARMRRLCTYAAMATAATAVLSFAPPALAAVSSGDASATRDYLQADLARTRAEVGGLSVAIAAMEALRGRLQLECPGVLAEEPKPAQGEKPSGSAIEIGEEEQGAVFGAAEHTEYELRRGFAHTVAHLSWSDRSLTRLVHADAAEELAQAQTPPPDLCSDMRAWVDTGYQTVSAATEGYVHRESTLSSETGGAQELIMHKLGRYESQADKRIAGRIAAVEKQAVETVLPEVLAALAKITEVLHGAAAVPAS